MTRPQHPPRRLAGDLLTAEDRQEYDELRARWEAGGIVPLSTLCALSTRIKRDAQFRYFPGRDQVADANWLIARELGSITELVAYFGSHRRLRAACEGNRQSELFPLLDLDRAA